MNADNNTTPTKKILWKWVLWFWLANSLLFYIIGLHYLLVISPFSSGYFTLYGKGLIITFIILAYLGQLAFLALFPCLVVFILSLFTQKRSLIFWVAIVILSLAACFLLIDTIVFNLYRFHLQGVILHMVFSAAFSHIFDFTWMEYLLIAGIFILIFLIETAIAFGLWHLINSRRLKHGLWPALILIFCFYSSYLIVIFSSGQVMYRPLSNASRFLPYYNHMLATIIPGKHALVGLWRFGEGKFLQPEQAYQQLNYPLHPLVCRTPKKLTNIIFIVIDSWRFDMLNAKVTPFLNQFAKQSLIFNNHYSGGNATRTGMFTLFYGLPATYWTAMEKYQRAPVFIQELIKLHYQMGIFSSASLKLPPFDKTLFAGIKNIPDETPGETPDQRDRYITKEFTHFINHKIDIKKPFFSVLIYDAPHSFCTVDNSNLPFRPISGICNRMELLRATNAEPYFNRYKNALFFVDEQIKSVISVLKRKQLLSNTLIIITGDHGQEFNDNQLGYWGHASNYTHFQVQTPLLIYWPGKGHKVYSYRTSHFDIAPTLLKQLFACKNPANDYSVGISLFNKTPRKYLLIGSYIDFGIVEKNRIIRVYPSGDYQIENLKGVALKRAKLNSETLLKVFKDMRRFYKENNE